MTVSETTVCAHCPALTNNALIIFSPYLAAVFKLLSDKKFGPQYYGLFENGRIEGWFYAAPLAPQDMAAVRA